MSAKKPNLNHTNKFTNHVSYREIQANKCLSMFSDDEKAKVVPQ
jgi:hypothetical protein